MNIEKKEKILPEIRFYTPYGYSLVAATSISWWSLPSLTLWSSPSITLSNCKSHQDVEIMTFTLKTC